MLPGAGARASGRSDRRAITRASLVLVLGILVLIVWRDGHQVGALREVPGPIPTADRGASDPSGQLNPSGCFECHPKIQEATERGQGRPGHRSRQTEPGDRDATDCEACHGPGRAHAESARQGGRPLAMPFGPGRSLPGEEVRMCGRCHGGSGALGEGSTMVGSPSEAHPLDLTHSACYRASEGRLSCTTCHDPHRSDGQDRARYERVCLDCHQRADRRPSVASCPVAARSGCVECHLPMVPAGDHRFVSDHRIRKPPGRGRP